MGHNQGWKHELLLLPLLYWITPEEESSYCSSHTQQNSRELPKLSAKPTKSAREIRETFSNTCEKWKLFWRSKLLIWYKGKSRIYVTEPLLAAHLAQVDCSAHPWTQLCWKERERHRYTLWIFLKHTSAQRAKHNTTKAWVCSNTEISGYTRPATFLKSVLFFFFFPSPLLFECQDHGLGNSTSQRMKKKKKKGAH